MISQVHACGSPEVERLVTDDARVGLDAGVTQCKVQQQLIGRGKSQAALGADVRTSLQVYVLMLVQALRLKYKITLYTVRTA